MVVFESLIATGAGFGATWQTAFGGKVGAWVEAATVCVATAIVTDLMAQSSEISVEHSKEDDEEDKINQHYDCGRVARYGIIGALYGPVEYIYFIGIDKAFPWWGQVLFDNIVFIPIMTGGGILINIMLRDTDEVGKQKVSVFQEYKQKMWDTLKIGLPMWLCLDCIMFTIIPLRHRVAFSRIGGFGYLIWCSHVLNDPHHDPTGKWEESNRGSELGETGAETCSRCPATPTPVFISSSPLGPQPSKASQERASEDKEKCEQGRS